MEEYFTKIISIEQVTHDVKRFRVERPAGYSFFPGQATNVSVNTPELKNKKRAFTFTCLKTDPYLEFYIKIYPLHKGVTNELDKLKPGDFLIIRNAWGNITYKGKGVFIAGGAGITPFISIFRDLASRNEIAGNRLLYANRTRADIILEKEFRLLLGKDFINILSEEKAEGYSEGMINEEFLKTYIGNPADNIYLCGPPPMMEAVRKQLIHLGVRENLIISEF